MALSRITNYIEADGADLNLQSSDTTITADSVLGVINFKAPSEASGTDSILLASKIEAIAEGTFSASSNATSLIFSTASSEAAGTAGGGGKLTLQSNGTMILKDQRTDANAPGITFQTGNTNVAQDNLLGNISFQAPDEATGTDANLIAAAIVAVSEGDFSSSSNATSLVFRTGASETATDKMTLSSAGLLTVVDDIVIKSGGTIGGANDTDLLTLGNAALTVAGTIGGTAITASGILKTDDTTDATSTTDGSLQTDGGLSVAKDAVIGDDLLLLSDSAAIKFGADSEITLTHSADSGLLLKHAASGDDKFPTLILQTGDTDIAANDVLGSIEFQAPDEGTGTDAVLVAGGIRCVSTGDFSSSVNTTQLEFRVSISETATTKMLLSPAGAIRTNPTSGGNTIFNDDGVDADFTIESTGSDAMFHLDAANDRVGIGTGGPQTNLEVKMPAPFLRLEETTSGGSKRMEIGVDGSGNPIIRAPQSGGNLQFVAVSTETMRMHTNRLNIASSPAGNTMSFADVADGSATQGTVLGGQDTTIAVNSQFVLEMNRTGNDGTVVLYKQAGTTEGSVSISGSTTSYNAFTGSHWSRLTDNSQPTIPRGTVMETIDEMMDWYHLEFTKPEVLFKEGDALPEGKNIGDVKEGENLLKKDYDKPSNVNVGDIVQYEENFFFTMNGTNGSGANAGDNYLLEDGGRVITEKSAGNGTVYDAVVCLTRDVKHVKTKISDTADCTNVYGVFMDWDNDDDNCNDMYVNAVGTSLVRVHSSQTVAKGDLLVSNGDGTAKKLAADTSITAGVYSTIIGKVLTNIKQDTYSDDSYTVPCALYCG